MKRFSVNARRINLLSFNLLNDFIMNCEVFQYLDKDIKQQVLLVS